jgi:hypothetical protein
VSIVVQSLPAVTLAMRRRVLVLCEDRLAHYPEFREFFVREFALDPSSIGQPGYVQAPSGLYYELIFIGRSGEAFPSGLEVHALVETLEPMDDTAVDGDLWQLLRWMFAGVGGEWSVEALDATGRLYRVPAATISNE